MGSLNLNQHFTHRFIPIKKIPEILATCLDKSRTPLTIFSWDSTKFSNFTFLQWWDTPKCLLN